jgi:hydrogenase/urease accessory protein HupE
MGFERFYFRIWKLFRTSSFGFRALLLMVFAAASFFVPAARAHEVRPAYLELKETAPGQFSVLWRTPVLSGMRLPVALKLPDDVRNVREPVVQELTDSLVERRWIDAGPNGLAGKRVEFPGLQLTITDVLVRVQLLDGRSWTSIVRPSQPWMEIAASPTGWEVAGAYLQLGVEHILGGIDHLLFVLALMLLVTGWKRLVATVTAFTVAHSITLAAATLGFVTVPGRPVEACIALSIVFVASEIVRARQGDPGMAQRWPWLVAFTFGLLHGFGFAGALSEVGLPQNAIPLALAFFNIGVELGQLAFIAFVLAVIAVGGKVAHRFSVPRSTWAWRVPPYAIGSLAAFWVIERISAF